MISFSIITHTNYIDNKYVLGPADSLANYLIGSGFKVEVISLSFSKFKLNKIFSNGQEVVSQISNLRCFKYINDFFFLRNNLRKSDVYIAVDPISFISAYILKKEKVVLYLVDYSENRSKNILVNYIYQLTIWFSVKKSKVVISSAEKIFKRLNIPFKKRIFLPNYPLTTRPDTLKDYKKIKSVLPFTDINKLNYKLIIDAISLAKFNNIKIINFSLDFIGVKTEETDLVRYIKEKKVDDIVNYLYINNKNIYSNVIKNYNLGFDINFSKYSYSEYRDPIKIREYIFYGIPVITTKNNAIYEEIQKNKIGIVLNNDLEFFMIINELVLGKIDLQILNNNLASYYKFDIESIVRRLELMESI